MTPPRPPENTSVLTTASGVSHLYYLMLLGSGSSDDDVPMDLRFFFVVTCPIKNATPELHLASRGPGGGFTPAPRSNSLRLRRENERRLPTRRAGTFKSRPPGDESARSSWERRIIKELKSQHEAGINSACTNAGPSVSTTVLL